VTRERGQGGGKENFHLYGTGSTDSRTGRRVNKGRYNQEGNGCRERKKRAIKRGPGFRNGEEPCSPAGEGDHSSGVPGQKTRKEKKKSEVECGSPRGPLTFGPGEKCCPVTKKKVRTPNDGRGSAKISDGGKGLNRATKEGPIQGGSMPEDAGRTPKAPSLEVWEGRERSHGDRHRRNYKKKAPQVPRRSREHREI